MKKFFGERDSLTFIIGADCYKPGISGENITDGGDI
jgi:hypothetical protein